MPEMVSAVKFGRWMFLGAVAESRSSDKWLRERFSALAAERLSGLGGLMGGVVMLEFVLGYLVGAATSEPVKASPPMSTEEALFWALTLACLAALGFVLLLRSAKRSI